jgi:threonyl-tRNA synthetase
VLPISDRHLDYAREVERQLREAGIRAEVDDRTESVGKKIRDGELRKVPLMLVVGDKEQEAGQVAVRRHREGDQGAQPVADVIDAIRVEIESRRAILASE